MNTLECHQDAELALSRETALTSSARRTIFATVLLIVGAISFYDGYLVVRTDGLILEYEKNPIGLYLIQFNHGDPAIFLRLKAAGTMLVLASLHLLQRRSPRMAGPVAGALVLFQIGLVLYLELPA